MNEFILNYAPHISIAIRVVALAIVLVFVFPLQIREFGVKNGLAKLRLQLMLFGLLMLLTNAVSIYFLYDLIVKDIHFSFQNGILQGFNAFGYLGFALIGHRIYHQQYTPKQKKVHQIADKIEKSREAAKRKLAKSKK